eukprot:gb/GEZN01016258.1/.p1 GENE.gb/GEZN01016258.1/~~gb/GEZN01016258.1/.p1  ORF type:complete len:180 (-),score=29.18 gb/GEZN01016258.1/:182-721(-)
MLQRCLVPLLASVCMVPVMSFNSKTNNGIENNSKCGNCGEGFGGGDCVLNQEEFAHAVSLKWQQLSALAPLEPGQFCMRDLQQYCLLTNNCPSKAHALVFGYLQWVTDYWCVTDPTANFGQFQGCMENSPCIQQEVFSQQAASFAAVDSDQNGEISCHEYEMWPLVHDTPFCPLNQGPV